MRTQRCHGFRSEAQDCPRLCRQSDEQCIEASKNSISIQDEGDQSGLYNESAFDVLDSFVGEAGDRLSSERA